MERQLQPAKLHSIEHHAHLNEDLPSRAADGPITANDYLSKKRKRKAKGRNKSVGAAAGRRFATTPGGPDEPLSDPETLHDHE